MDIKKLKDAHGALSAGRVAMSILAAVTSAAFVGAFAYDRTSNMLGSTGGVIAAIVVSIAWAFVFDAGIYKLTPFIFNSLANFKDAIKNGRRIVLLAGAILLLLGMSLSSIYTSLTAASVTVNMVTDVYSPVTATQADNSQVLFLSKQLANVSTEFNKASSRYNKAKQGTNTRYIALKDRNALADQMKKITKQYEDARYDYNKLQGEYQLTAQQTNSTATEERNEQVTVFATLYRYIGLISTILFLFFSLCKELLEIEYPSVAVTDSPTLEDKVTESVKTPTKQRRNKAVTKKQEQPVYEVETVTATPNNVTIAKSNIGFATAGSEKQQQQKLKAEIGEEQYNAILARTSGRDANSLLAELRARKSRMKNFGFAENNYNTCRVIMEIIRTEKNIDAHEQEIEMLKQNA